MYWPVGAPKVYSLSKRATADVRTTRSNDGLEQTGTSQGASHAGLVGGEAEVSGGNIEDAAPPKLSGHGDANGAVHDADTVGSGAEDSEILSAKLSRGGGIFATITRSSLTVWQAKPIVALAAVVRSPQSIRAYGPNCALLLRPDALIIVVQTTHGYLITYTLATDPQALVYRTQLPESHRHNRKGSVDGYRSYLKPDPAFSNAGPGEGEGIREVNLRFRMVIRIDAGIGKALALDDELVVATQKPAALQCIRWVAEEGKAQTSTELLSRLPWFTTKTVITEMVHDRPMNLTCWVTSDGKAYAVQRRSGRNTDMEHQRNLFQGFCFRDAETGNPGATKVAINARFSLIAVGCTDGSIEAYGVKDYAGNIPLSHKYRLPAGMASPGQLTHLMYSPDGYSLFAGYENGWCMWSVYGKPGASSFGTDKVMSESNGERWLQGVREAFWVGGGCELVILCPADDRIWLVEIARQAAAGCLSPTNIARGLLQASTAITLYQGHDVQDLTSLSSDVQLWQTVQIPNAYLLHQWPIKVAAVSSDSKYVAVAGRRGLAHYSITSSRWKTFDDAAAEHDFAVKGGMCWHQHFLIAAVEAGNRHQLRIYSREKALERTVHVEELAAPALLITMSGSDSLLVYTHDNILMHFIMTTSGNSVKLVQVGQIGFHGIIRAPPRVRAISWILPEYQLEHGDPSQDVATASVLFLVDGKLVLLQPSFNEYGELKYDMRVIAQNVEYFLLLRDQPSTLAELKAPKEANNAPNGLLGGALGHSLRDSLWYFDVEGFHVWSDVQDVLACAPAELGRELPPTVRVPVDFYPVSVMVAKGIVHGLDSEAVQRRDINFSFFRHAARTQLFLPQLLRHHLAEYNSPAALHLASSYQYLPYFAHALEILLHDVLDSEVDSPPSPPETALLPTVISFLSSFPAYLDIIVNCTRKTELRSWRTLFTYLPPVQQLFEQSLEDGKLKTAAGYLLVLHAFEQEGFHTRQFARLLRRASAELDWDLCGELARFLVGIDGSGQTLSTALADAGLQGAPNGDTSSVEIPGVVRNGHTSDSMTARLGNGVLHSNAERQGRESGSSGLATDEGVDYFSRGQLE